MKRLPVLVRACRPRQWTKNVLVLMAPIAAGVLSQPRAILQVAIVFIAFCAAASGIYLVNDALDLEADREHPTKWLRPVASGNSQYAQHGLRQRCSCLGR